MIFKQSQHHSGQTILEILLATAIIAILLVSLIALSTYSSKSSTYAKQLNQATDYSNQLADWLRDQKQLLGWFSFLQLLEEDTNNNYVTYCFNNLPSTTNDFRNLSNSPCPSTAHILNTNFTRQATFDLSQTDQGIITVNITTSWQDNIKYQTTMQIKLSRWN